MLGRLDRARDLAERGLIPAGHAQRWLLEAQSIQDFIETRCFSHEKRSYIRHAGSGELDARLLLGVLASYGDATTDRWATTVEAVRRELGNGPFVRRYSGEDGLEGSEGAFLTSDSRPSGPGGGSDRAVLSRFRTECLTVKPPGLHAPPT